MNKKIFLSILIFCIGFIINGFAFVTTLGHPISTICLLCGLGFMFFGIIYFFINVLKK